MYREHKKGETHNLAWQQMAAQERILIESETKKLLLQEALFTTTMSKARAPKRKEEYVPPNEIEEFCKEILEAGRHLAVVSSPCFPDAERVSKAIGKVLTVVKDHMLVGMWVSSRVSNTTTQSKVSAMGTFLGENPENTCIILCGGRWLRGQ
jgi:hypothetical protein